MFHPSVNRLASFLEISALAMSLVQSGGVQHKAGYLWIEAVRGKGKGFGHKSTSWIEKTQYRWCVAMESYLVVLDQPGEVLIIPYDYEPVLMHCVAIAHHRRCVYA